MIWPLSEEEKAPANKNNLGNSNEAERTNKTWETAVTENLRKLKINQNDEKRSRTRRNEL